MPLTRPHILGIKGQLKKTSEENSEKPVGLCPAWAWGRKQRIRHKANMAYLGMEPRKNEEPRLFCLFVRPLSRLFCSFDGLVSLFPSSMSVWLFYTSFQW